MAQDLVLITGATGHIGFRTLILALQAGYTVRAAVRSEPKSQQILSNPIFKSFNFPSSQLSFVIVPDLCVPGAYDDAVRDVKLVIHIASPLTTGGVVPQDEYEKYFIEPAVQGTIGMLESAKKAGTVKRVVITSSIVAIIPLAAHTSVESPETFDASSRQKFWHGPYAVEIEAYSAGKTAALSASEMWMKDHKPGFDLVNIHPSYVMGRDDLILSKDRVVTGTNAIILAPVALGKSFTRPMAGGSVHSEDVAFMHVEALKMDKIPGNESYVANVDTKWEGLSCIVKKLFPKEVESGLLNISAETPSLTTRVDTKKSEEVFGFKFRDFEEQVKSVVGHYVELATVG